MKSWVQRKGRGAAARLALAAALALVVAFAVPGTGRVAAQSALGGFLYTAGTTVTTGAQAHAYVVLDSVDGVAARGRTFVVYGKAGAPTNAGNFTLRGTLAPAPDAATAQSRLNQSLALGQNTAALAAALNGYLGRSNAFFAGVPAISNQALADKVITALRVAATNATRDQGLRSLALAHPGLLLCFGQAFSEPIPGVTTYEVRQAADGVVVGRVTVNPGAPVVLPAPGRPFQVVSNQPSDHLRVRLRWGTPPELRRVSVLNLGFNVWRITRAEAEAFNWHLMPPTAAQLRTDPRFSLAHRVPASAPVALAPGNAPGGAEDPADRTTVFLTDDGRGMTGGGQTNQILFADGQEYYYFVTARDLLGRDGLVSPAGLARVCRRDPPAAPGDVQVDPAVVPGTTNASRLQVSWRQNTNAADRVTHYWIYRWRNPAGALGDDSLGVSNRVGEVAQVPGAARSSFLDNTAGALTNAAQSNVWYTVRAVDRLACDPLASAHAGPAWGALREYDAPDAPQGEVLGNCGAPVVVLQGVVTNAVNPDPQVWNFRLACLRRDPGVAWVQFAVTNQLEDAFGRLSTNVTVLGPIHFPPGGDALRIDYPLAAQPTAGLTNRLLVGCTVGTFGGQISAGARGALASPVPSGQQRELVFYAGQVLAAGGASTDALLIVGECVTPFGLEADASGMVTFLVDPVWSYTTRPTLVQVLTNGNVWSDLGVFSSDATGRYWVPYPQCLLGPLPPFRVCGVSLPAAGDCEQHVTGAASGGAGSAAPLRVRFRLQPRAREYRLYRRVDDGPLLLLAQGRGEWDPLRPEKALQVADDGLPPSAARVCYYVQLLDRHGRGSPLAEIGCKWVTPPKLPRPVLSEPVAGGTAGSPQVVLNWFCPTAGVSRFQVKIKAEEPSGGGTATGLLGGGLVLDTTYNPRSTFAGLVRQTVRMTDFTGAQLTPRLGPGFGPGPAFTLTAGVLPNVRYEISVAAVDLAGNVHESSETWPFLWTPPVVLANVPWPARDLPPVRPFDDERVSSTDSSVFRLRAVLLREFANGPVDRRYPVGVAIGDFSRLTELDNGDCIQLQLNVQTPDPLRYWFNPACRQSGPDPNEQLLYRRRSPRPERAGASCLPLVLYRQQVPNALFPAASGALVQVSPLVERIPWFQDGNGYVIIPDRLMGAGWGSQRLLGFGDIQFIHQRLLVLRDQQPVVRGALYRYFAVRFNAQREPEEIIPAGLVEIPDSL